jgi:competence protein ComEC
MRAPLVYVPALALFAGLVAGQSQTAKTLGIYLIDVEGGNAQLYRLPSGQSVLIDSGNGGAAATRDAARIMAAVKDAGLTQINSAITSAIER